MMHILQLCAHRLAHLDSSVTHGRLRGIVRSSVFPDGGFDVTFERAGCLTCLAVMALQVEAFAKDFPTIGFEKASMRYKD